MQSRLLLYVVSIGFAICAPSAHGADPIIADARKLSGDEIQPFLANRTFTFVVRDQSYTLTGTSTWDPDRERVYGKYSLNQQASKKWSRSWYVNDGMNCTKPGDGDVECNYIYVKDDEFIEVKADGTIHATSVPID